MLGASKQGTEARHCPVRALAGEQAPPTASSTFTFQFLALGFFFPTGRPENCPYPIRLIALVVIPFSHSVILPAQGLFSGGGRGAALVFFFFGFVLFFAFEAFVLCVGLCRCIHDINVYRDHRTVLGNWFSPSTWAWESM